MRKNGFYEARAEQMPQFDPDGVVVAIQVHRGPRVRVVFTGDPLTKDQQKLVMIRAEASVAEDLLENSTFAIEQDLRERGYRDAKAPYARVENDSELTITFDVHRGPRYLIADLTTPGRQAISEDDLWEGVAASLGQERSSLEALLKEGQPFFEQVADGVAAAIRQTYLDRGFSRVTVSPAYNVDAPESAADARRVHVVFAINEGAQVLLNSLSFSGNSFVPTDELEAIFRDTGTEVGKPFSQSNLVASLAALDAHYHDLGFAAVERGEPAIVLHPDSADVLIPITENMRVFIDRIIIEGNERTSRTTIERELTLHPGDPLGATKKLESEERVRSLGFRRVRIDERRHLGDERVDLLVRVEEGQRTTIEYGPGLEISSRLRPVTDGVAEERIEFVPRGSFQISRTNIFGTNGSATFFSRVSARAKDTTTELGVVDSSYGINEYRVFGTFREPKFLGTPAQALFTAIAERAIRPSYTFVTREARAEVGGTVDRNYSASLRFSVKRTQLFDVDPNLTEEEKPLIDRLFPQVRLSKVSSQLTRNTRRDLGKDGKPNDLDPSAGTFISIEPEIAARAIGSEVGYVKNLLQLSWYHQLPFTRRTILALRGVFGAAHGFSRQAPRLENGIPALNGDGSPQLETVQDIPASERFFAGGSTTNRGFSVDQLGQPNLCGGELPGPKCTFTPGGFPTGGNGELLMNTELRVSLSKSFAGVGFLDVGNIYKSAADISLRDVRPAIGGGLHYRSPVGLVRVELGFNLDRQELTPGRFERPYVLHISLGPAF
jgi:outer membrane protein assembly complex protein YaeT